MELPLGKNSQQLEAVIARAEELLADIDLLGLTAVAAKLSLALDQLYLERNKRAD